MRHQIIRTICFMSIAICLSAGLCIAASWELVYTADVLPDDKSLGKEAWERGKDGQWPGKPEFGKIEPAGELHINDPSNAGDNYLWYARWFDKKEDAEHTTIEARVKSLNNTDGHAVCMSIDNQGALARLFMFPDHLEIWEAGQKHNVDMTSYHIVRLTRKGKEVKAYLDDKEVLKGAPKDYVWDYSRVVFGALSSAGIGEAYWDYIAYTTQGAFSPDELRSGLAVEFVGKLTTSWVKVKQLKIDD